MERVVGELQRRALALRTTPLLRVIDRPSPGGARRGAAGCGKSRGGGDQPARSSSSTVRSSTGWPIRWATWCAMPSITGSRRPSERRRSRQAGGRPHRDRGAPRARQRSASRFPTTGGGSISRACAARAIAAGHRPSRPGRGPPSGRDCRVRLPARPVHGRERVSEISGRGVGMDAVKTTIESPWAVTSRSPASPVTWDVHGAGRSHHGGGAAGAAGGDGRGSAWPLPIAKVERLLEVAEEAIEVSRTVRPSSWWTTSPSWC